MIRTTLAAMLAATLAPIALSQDVTGQWSGRYICGQGITALDLSIRKGGAADALTAIFSFGPLPENPEVPKGAYEMKGTYDPKSRHVVLDGVKWLQAPFGYAMVGLDGHISQSGDRISGRVPDNFPCTDFEVWRPAQLVG